MNINKLMIKRSLYVLLGRPIQYAFSANVICIITIAVDTVYRSVLATAVPVFMINITAL